MRALKMLCRDCGGFLGTIRRGGEHHLVVRRRVESYTPHFTEDGNYHLTQGKMQSAELYEGGSVLVPHWTCGCGESALGGTVTWQDVVEAVTAGQRVIYV